MNPMTVQAFDAATANLRLTDPVREACRAHMVDGRPVLEVCAQYRVSTAGFYRAANAIQPRSEADTPTSRLVFVVPDHHVDELRARVAWQLAKWRDEDAAKRAELDGVGIDD